MAARRPLGVDHGRRHAAGLGGGRRCEGGGGKRAAGGAGAGGLAGAVIGNQFGKGAGNALMTGAGAIGGALLGQQMANNMARPQLSRQWTVRLDGGGSVACGWPP